MEDLKQHYLDELKRLSNLEYCDEIKIAELTENFNGMSIEIRKKEKLLQLEQWAYLSTHPSKCLNSFCYDDDDDDEDYTIAVTPSFSIEEPDNSLSMGDEHLDTILVTESDEFIKSSVENLIPIPSESEGIPEHMCDVPFHDNSPPLDVSKDQIENTSESNDEFSSTDDDSFSIDNIDYVEASPPDSELVSSEVIEIVIPKVGGIDDDILLTIKDDILREKLLNVNLLIANPTPSFDCKTKSSSNSINSLLEETNISDNSLPVFETFCFDVKVISSGSPTTHSDSSLYASFIFDLSINPFPPADRSDFYESTDELIPFISLPEYDCFLFTVKPNSRDFTKDVVEDISPIKEPQVHNALPTHPTLQLNLKFQPSSESLFTYVHLQLSFFLSRMYLIGVELSQDSKSYLKGRWRFSLPLAPPWTNEFGVESGSRIVGIRRVVPRNYNPKGERFLIASRFPAPPLAYAFFSLRATVTSSSKLARDQTSNPTSSTNPTPKGQIRRSSKQKVENSHFEEHLTPVATMTNNRTMAEMLRAPTKGCTEAIVVPLILAEKFELKHSLINMMTLEQFFGLEKNNPHDHKLDESFHEAWERYKDLLCACPHHGFTELHQLDTFYNALNPADQDSLNAAAGGKLLVKSPQDALTIIENKSKVRNSRSKPIASPVNSCDNHSSSELAKLTHAVNQQTSAVTTAMTAVLKQFQSNPPPTQVKAVEEICVTYRGAHPYYQCLVVGGNTFPEYRDNIQGYVSAATCNYNQGNPGYQSDASTSLKAMQNQIDMVKNELRNEMKASIQTSLSNQTNEIINMMASLLQMNTASTSRSGTLLCNTIANPKGELKAITTRSGLVTDGPTVPNPPKSVKPEEDECVEETYTDPDHVEYNIKVPPPPLVQKPKPPIQRNFVLHTRDSLPPHISYPSRMNLELANRAICTPDGIARDVFVPVGKFTFPADFVVVDYESDPRVPLILGRPFLRTARALIDAHGDEIILRDGDERLTLNMKHDTASYSNHPRRDSVNLINIFNLSNEDCLEDLVSNKQSGNPTFSLHKEIASPEVIPEIHNSKGCSFLSEEFPNIDSFNDIHPHFDDDPLSGSTAYSANSLLEEFTDELALISYPPDYDDTLACDIEFDIREIEFLLYQGEDFDFKDSIDKSDLANLDDLFVDPTPEMFTNEQPPDYSFPPRFDMYPDDFLEIESDDTFDDELIDSEGEKIKEAELLIDQLDLPCDILSEYDSFNSQDFSRDDVFPSPDNEDKVFNPGILIHEKSVKIITRVTQEKKLAVSYAFWLFEDFDPPFYELLVFKEVPNSMRLLPFSFENKEKVFKPRIYTPKKFHCCFLSELSHPGERKTRKGQNRIKTGKKREAGTEGVVGLSRWCEKIESVFHISGCAIENQEKVDKYIGGLPGNIHRNVMSARPKTLDEAIELANDLMDQKIHTYTERQTKSKRKFYNNNQGQKFLRGRMWLKLTLLGLVKGRRISGILLLLAIKRPSLAMNVRIRGYKSDCPELKNQNHGNQNEALKGGWGIAQSEGHSFVCEVDNVDEMTTGSLLFSWRKADSRCLALDAARKGHPKMIGTNSSSSISKTTKSTEKINLLTFTNRFSQTSMGYLIDRSASWILILVGLCLEIPSRQKREFGMRFILAPKLARAFFTARGPMRLGGVELPGTDGQGAGSYVMLGSAPLCPSFLVSPSVELSVDGCGGTGKGLSLVLILDLVVMAKVGASGSEVLLLLIAERI
uniref:Reverse transcriptase domain-containing protein n=1 Tax=Tanacetum cinerariifolium TaxID=118510 RepID=A0A6L2M4R1_TANCI|nr:reverse transcriptase domain-containing protein [Tanacetum cinerariifolium]